MGENQSVVMPVQPMNGYGYGNDGFGGNAAWLILFLFAMMGGGFGFGRGYGGGNYDNGNFGGSFPWLLNANQNTANDVANGFAQQNIQNAINSGFAGLNQTLCSNEVASLNRSFAEQSAVSQGFNGMQSQLAQCCCDNRLATANLSALVQSENCADREALSNGIRDIIANQNAGYQRILDQMCNDKIDSKNEKIAELQNQVMMRDLAASRAAQTAALVADNTAQTQYMVNRIAPYPIPAYQVANPYGNNSCTCGCNTGCGGF